MNHLFSYSNSAESAVQQNNTDSSCGEGEAVIPIVQTADVVKQEQNRMLQVWKRLLQTRVELFAKQFPDVLTLNQQVEVKNLLNSSHLSQRKTMSQLVALQHQGLQQLLDQILSAHGGSEQTTRKYFVSGQNMLAGLQEKCTQHFEVVEQVLQRMQTVRTPHLLERLETQLLERMEIFQTSEFDAIRRFLDIWQEEIR